jgi:hypothetical protein
MCRPCTLVAAAFAFICAPACFGQEYPVSQYKCGVCNGFISMDGQQCLSKCPTGQVIMHDNLTNGAVRKSCYRACFGGQFRNSTSGICQSCPSDKPFTSIDGKSCLTTCPSGTTATLTVKNGWAKQGYKCLKPCPAGYILLRDGTGCARSLGQYVQDKTGLSADGYYSLANFDAAWNAAKVMKNEALGNASLAHNSDCPSTLPSPGTEGDELTEHCFIALMKWNAYQQDPFKADVLNLLYEKPMFAVRKPFLAH